MNTIFSFDATLYCSVRRFVFCVSMLCAMLTPITAAHALMNHCVTDETELQEALTAAQTNGQDDTIQVASGIYEGTFTFTSSEGFGITLLGGYDGMCCFRDADPSNTVLDGQNAGTVLRLRNTQGGNIRVDGFTIRNGNNTIGAGLYIRLFPRCTFLVHVFLCINSVPDFFADASNVTEINCSLGMGTATKMEHLSDEFRKECLFLAAAKF